MPSEIVEMRNPGAGVLNDAGATGIIIAGSWLVEDEGGKKSKL